MYWCDPCSIWQHEHCLAAVVNEPGLEGLSKILNITDDKEYGEEKKGAFVKVKCLKCGGPCT